MGSLVAKAVWVGLVVNYVQARFLVKDPAMAWVAPFFEKFPFSMQPSDECHKILHDFSVLRKISQASPDDEKAQEDWMAAIKACHGPLPLTDADAMRELSLKNYWESLKKCGKKEGTWVFS